MARGFIHSQFCPLLSEIQLGTHDPEFQILEIQIQICIFNHVTGFENK